MLATISAQNPRYENLGGHLMFENRKRAGGILPGGTFKSPRLESRPTAQPPAPSKIPTSSQKPFAKTNARLPYARYAVPMLGNIRPIDLGVEAGDIMFVARTSQSLGRGANREIKATGLGQLREYLRLGTTANVLNYGDNSTFNAVMATRRANGVTSTVRSFEPIDVHAFPLIKEWSVDGVLISRDTVSENEGMLLNVAIAGPTPLRNTPRNAMRTNSEPFEQHLDERVSLLDKIYVGVFVQATDANVFRAHLIPYTSRHVDVPGAMAALLEAEKCKDAVLAGAWKVGSVMDSMLTTGRNRSMQINVCVEWQGATGGMPAMERIPSEESAASAKSFAQPSEDDEEINEAEQVEEVGGDEEAPSSEDKKDQEDLAKTKPDESVDDERTSGENGASNENARGQDKATEYNGEPYVPYDEKTDNGTNGNSQSSYDETFDDASRERGKTQSGTNSPRTTGKDDRTAKMQGQKKPLQRAQTVPTVLPSYIKTNNLAAALADLAPAWNAWIRLSKKDKVAKAAPMRAHAATLQKIINLGKDVPSAEFAAHMSADAPDDHLRLFSTVHEYMQTATKTTLKALKLNK